MTVERLIIKYFSFINITGECLALSNLVLASCIESFKILNFYVLPTVLSWVFYGSRNKERQFTYKALGVKQSLYRPIAEPDGARRLRLPDFKTIGTW
jgi:hypothetical protein